MTGSNTILMVEDYADIVTVYTYMLESNGYKVEVARDGEEALAKTLSMKPDVILLDIMIPKIDGVTVLQTIRTSPEYKDIQPRILIMSNLLQQDIADKAKRFGADGYVVKANMRNMDLVAIVTELFARPKRAPVDAVETPAPAATAVTPAAATIPEEPTTEVLAQPPLETPPTTPPSQTVDAVPQESNHP